jgi:Oligosaccharyl transferase STT3 subunit
MWGILPATDSHLYYSAAFELLNGQHIAVMAGARQPYPLLLAVLLKIFRHDLRAVTLVFTIVLALATWSAVEAIRLRLGGLAAAAFLVCVAFYIRIHSAGLFMTEQLALLYSLCAVGMLVESVAREGNAKAWPYCGGLFFLLRL